METAQERAPAGRDRSALRGAAVDRVRRLTARMDAVDLPAVLRPVFVLAQAASIVITWPLWQVRSSPPLLPLIDGVPRVDMAVVLLATVALILFKPEAGVVAHSVALAAAFVMDQTRMQPEFISLAILLWGTTRIPLARVIAAAHLVTLWFWSGLNKALSLGFHEESASFLFYSFPVHPQFLRPYFGWMIIAMEMSIAVLLLIPRSRRVGVWLAVGLHFLGLVTLVNAGWNESVWPWNAALAVAAVAFFWSRAERWASRTAIVVLAALALMPVGFYAGLVDAYLAHNLYTSNTASAQICRPDGTCEAGPWFETWIDLRVPLPPEHRLFRGYFEKVCAPGETLHFSPRDTRILFGRHTSPSTYDCPASS